jgi:hypothetical protein
MAFYPRYFDQPVANNSDTYNYYRWNAENRGSAAQYITVDLRPQPKPQERIRTESRLRVLCPPGGLILFSGAQLHETVANTSGTARYSMDFRTVHLGDLREQRAAANVDSRCTGTTLRDFLRAGDLEHLPAEIVALYDDESADAGVLVYPARGQSAHPAGIRVPDDAGAT